MGSSHINRQGASGYLPHYGAIFMSDNATRKECFEKKLFGLPSNFSYFVAEVKTGMPLFLFDYQERKLYGVFEARSDGAMNIVRDAYTSSRKQFPAQVRFSIIWRCYPLPEPVFRHAIKENYFAPYKFHFGLSKNQVERLLYLFEKREIKTQIPRSLVQKRKYKKRCQITEESAVECQPNSADSSEPLPNSMPAKPASSGVSDVGLGSDLDFIPLPSSDDEETQSPMHDELAESDANSLYPGEDECLLKQDMCSSGPLCDRKEEGDKLTQSGSGYQANKRMYSDCPNKRKSAFLRLSGLTGLIKNAKGRNNNNNKNNPVESHQSNCDKKVNDSREILERLDNIFNMWKATNAEDKGSKNRTSAFSRLSFNVGKAPKIKQTSKIEQLEAQKLKCKKSCITKNAAEVEGNFPGNEENFESCHSMKHKIRKLAGDSSQGSHETQGSTAETLNKGSFNTREVVSSKDGHSMTFSCIGEGDGTRSGEDSIEGDKICPENAISVSKEPDDGVFMEMCEAVVNSRSCLDGDGESDSGGRMEDQSG